MEKIVVIVMFFFSSRRRHTRWPRDWSSDVCSSDLNGIVPKAIVRALYQEVSSSGAQTGGSTLTQQLIKNQILTNEVSFERKAKEILLAMRLENFFEKDEILEAYLNIIPYGRNSAGRNIAGIQTAAQGVFGVDASELNIPQAAYLSGLPQNPYAYTPFLNSGEVKKEESLQLGLGRMNTVLKRMYQNDFISEEEYNEALHYDIVSDFIEPRDDSLEKYPAIVYELEKRAIEVIIEKIGRASCRERVKSTRGKTGRQTRNSR